MRFGLLTAATFALLGAAVGWWYWDALPDPMPIHWNAGGEADGWGSRGMALAIGPGLSLFVPLLIAGVLQLDPRRTVEQLGEVRLGVVMAAFGLFGLAIQAMTVQAGLAGHEGSLDTRIVLGAVGLLIAVVGGGMRGMRSNWVYGIRTPWTLESETVWDRTHRLGAVTMVLGGAVCALVPWGVDGGLGFGIAIGAVLVGALVPAVASWWFFQQEQADAS